MTGRLDPRESWSAIDRCSIGKALDVVRNRSTFLLMLEAFYGTTRFEDFAERVGLSDPVTAARLRELVDEGLLEREDYREPGKRTRQRYRLRPLERAEHGEAAVSCVDDGKGLVLRVGDRPVLLYNYAIVEPPPGLTRSIGAAASSIR